MNDTLADAVFLEHSRRETELARTGWMRPQPPAATTVRLRLAGLLLALAAWLAPAASPSPESHPAPAA